MSVNKSNTSVKDAIVGAAMNTTNGAYSAVLRTFSACHKQQHYYYIKPTMHVTVYSTCQGLTYI